MGRTPIRAKLMLDAEARSNLRFSRREPRAAMRSFTARMG